MENIIQLKTIEDQKNYSALAKYCFTDVIGWTDHLFPLEKQDHSWGIYKDQKLMAGINSLKFKAHAFEQLFTMSGISTVAASPEVRNKGYTRKILNHIIQQDAQDGAAFSTLRPFDFGFYEKFGYGYCQGYQTSRFHVELLSTGDKPEGEFREFSFTQKELDTYYDFYDQWVSQYTFGLLSRRKSLKDLEKELDFQKKHFYIYYEKNQIKGALIFSFQKFGEHEADMIISRAIYAGHRSFKALLYFMASHRGHVREIHWKAPRSLPIHLFTKTPRIQLDQIQECMVRVLDAETLIKAKAQRTPTTEKLSFSLEDPLIEKNTGFYSIEGSKVTKEPLKESPQNAIELPLFSSLLFGGISLEEARLLGKVKDHTDNGAEEFFKPGKPLYLSELF